MKTKAYPRRVRVPNKEDEIRIDNLIADIPYNHNNKKYIIDGVRVYHIKLKTQEILAFKLAGFEVKK
jgi:hypothetical protein